MVMTHDEEGGGEGQDEEGDEHHQEHLTGCGRQGGHGDDGTW